MRRKPQTLFFFAFLSLPMGNFPALSSSAISSVPHGIKFGWLPDLPDARDYTRETPAVKALFGKRSSQKGAPPMPHPASLIDLRGFCPPIFDQGELGSCTANAAGALLEYHRLRSYNKTGRLSRLFIYKGTRDLMQAKGDSGAYIRTTMGSLALLGAPPEKYWEYDLKLLDCAPPSFCYSYAQNYQALSYFRLDSSKSGGNKEASAVLSDLRETLASGLPAMFGFTVYESMNGASNGKIPFPSENEKVLGGHAVLCVGYDDKMEISSQRGAFLIRNSWGEGWGEKGYGWLPYEYLLQGIAQDWWVLVKAEWVETEEFGV